jgi:hypothetical protein
MSMRTSKNTISAMQSPPAEPDRRKRRRFTADLILFPVCSLGIVCCIWLFYADLNSTLNRLNEQPIAVISFKRRAAQRRFADRMLWNRLRQDSPVYSGDLIRTADLSEATITFPGRPGISLDENSIIQVFPGRVDIAQGNLSVLDSGAGGGIVITAAGKTLDVPPGQAVSVEEGREAAPKIRALRPLPGAIYLARETAPVSFRWEASGTPGPLRLEIAADRNFTHTVITHDAEGGEAAAALQGGVWWWRVSGDGTASPVLKLSVVNALPPGPIAPAENAVISYRAKLPDIRLMWTETAEAAAYLVEVAAGPDFVSARTRTQVRLPSFVCTGLEEGVWYWRVRPVFEGNFTGSVDGSPVSSFTILREAGEPPAPVLAAARNITLGGENETAYLTWQRDVEAAAYTIYISKNADLLEPVITGTVYDSYYAFDAIKNAAGPGTYYWGVTETDAGGNVSPISAVSSFTIQAAPPPAAVETPPAPLGLPPASEPAPPAAAVETPSAPESPPVNPPPAAVASAPARPAPSESPPVNPPPAAASASARPAPPPPAVETRPAPPPGPPPLLPAPGGLRPDGMVFTPAELVALDQIEFTWNRVDGADAYLFTLSRRIENGPPEAIIHAGPLKGNSHAVDLPKFDRGDFEWQVEAVGLAKDGGIARHGRPAESGFTIELPPEDEITVYEPGELYGFQSP